MKNQKIALLRGINVGRKNRMKMAELIECLETAALAEVRTYIQSGNICFRSAKSCSKLEALIHEAICGAFGFDVPVMVREQSFFKALVDESPFCQRGEPKFEIAQLGVTLLGKKPATKAVKELAELKIDDEYVIAGDVIYLRLLSGFSKTKLTNNLLEKKLAVAATTRNWKTICKLIEM
jgi:uncharacterized protein (DUF1697 family)